jgi:hypothetical protein
MAKKSRAGRREIAKAWRVYGAPSDDDINSPDDLDEEDESDAEPDAEPEPTPRARGVDRWAGGGR